MAVTWYPLEETTQCRSECKTRTVVGNADTKATCGSARESSLPGEVMCQVPSAKLYEKYSSCFLWGEWLYYFVVSLLKEGFELLWAANWDWFCGNVPLGGVAMSSGTLRCWVQPPWGTLYSLKHWQFGGVESQHCWLEFRPASCCEHCQKWL